MKRKKILIAGINNFIGFHLALKLCKKFIIIGTLSKDIKKYNYLEKFRLSILKKKIKIIKYNTLNNNDVEKIINTYKPSVWIHNISISKNWEHKNFDYKKNLNSSSKDLYKIIPQLKKNNCTLFIHTGSSEEYCSRKGTLYEKILSPPSNSYGKMKFTLSKKILFLCKKNKLNCAIVRLFSPYGLLDKENKLFSILFKNANNQKITNLRSKRNFTFINDITTGYFKIINYLKNKNQYKIFNLANPKKISVLNILNKWNKTNRNNIKIFSHTNKSNLDKFYYGNPSLLSNKYIKNKYTNIITSFKIMSIQKKRLFKNYYNGL
jgi:nucleoside-diphosphate-sugar epimerase